MAWLQNLAGRAEDLLNKIDQNAATVLNETNTKPIKIEIHDLSNQELIKVEDNVIYPLNVPDYSNNEENISNIEPVENGTIKFDVVSEKANINSKDSDDNLDKSLKSSANSDKMSSTSSVHNSFSLAEESRLLHEKLSKLEFENDDLNKQLLNMKHLYSELRNEKAALQSQVERANELVAESQIEKERYIARAQRILQEKEKLISLKQESNSPEETENIFAAYNQELKKELGFQQERNEELNQKITHLTKDIQSLQMQHQVIQNGLKLENENLKKNLLNERQNRNVAEEECLQKNLELHAKNQEILELQEIIKNKNTELTQLQSVIKQRVPVNEDVESKIKSLTQTLMLKQNKLETVTTERNALRLQLERIENEYKEKIAQLQRFQVKTADKDDSEDILPLPTFMRVTPFDAGVTRRVKRAYSSLDTVSIRTGIFLRRYPLARVFVFCYMVLLHIWVLIILVSYAPNNR